MDRKGKRKQVAGTDLSSSGGKKRKGEVEFRDEGLMISKRKPPAVLQFFEESAEVGYYGGSSDDMEFEINGKEEEINEEECDRVMEEYADDDVKISIEMDALVPTTQDPPILKVKRAACKSLNGFDATRMMLLPKRLEERSNGGDWAKGAGTSGEGGYWNKGGASSDCKPTSDLNKPASAGDQSGGWNSGGQTPAPEASTVGGWGDAGASKAEAKDKGSAGSQGGSAWGSHGGGFGSEEKKDGSSGCYKSADDSNAISKGVPERGKPDDGSSSSLVDSEGFTKVKGKPGRSRRLNNPVEKMVDVFVDMETLEFRNIESAENFYQNINDFLASIGNEEEEEGNYHTGTITAFFIHAEDQNKAEEKRIHKALAGHGIRRRSFHRRKLRCKHCVSKRDAEMKEKGVKRGEKTELAQLEMLCEICLHALNLRKRGNRKTVMVLSDDTFFTEELVEDLEKFEHGGFTVLTDILEIMGLDRKPLHGQLLNTDRVPR